MEFLRTKQPKQLQRNGLIKTTGSSTIRTFSTGGSGGSSVITNYLPAYWDSVNKKYDVIDFLNFYNSQGMWEFFQRTTVDEETTDESGNTTTTSVNYDTSVLKITQDKMLLGDEEVLTTKHFYIDENGNIHTPFNLVSDGEITAFAVGNGGTGGGGGTTITNIVDNLTSTSSTDALSANQGRVLNEKINGISTHSHSNKSAIDTITNEQINNWNNAVTNSHTHGTNKNCDVYRLFVGNYGGIRSAETNNDILKFGDNDITLNSNGRNLYLGGNNTQTVYIPTYFDNGDGTTTAQWNSFTGTQLYMQMPMRIALQTHNNTQPPIYTNSTNVCTNLNADKVDGYDGTALVNNVAINGDNIVITKGTTSTNLKANYARKAQQLVNDNGTAYLSYYSDYVNITGTGGNIYLGSQAYKNNNYGIYFVTNDGTADTDGTVFWNHINGTQFLTQVPHRINLQASNNTQPPINVNTTTMCPNLNANYLGGYKQSDFVKTNGNQTIKGNITIDGNLLVNGSVTASDEIVAFATTLNQTLTTKIKTALQNVENATTLDDIKNILTNLKNSI